MRDTNEIVKSSSILREESIRIAHFNARIEYMPPMAGLDQNVSEIELPSTTEVSYLDGPETVALLESNL